MKPAFAALALLAAVGCTTGSTFRSGVGDRLLDRPPYRAGSGPVGTAPVGKLLIRFQDGEGLGSARDDRAQLTALLHDLDERLERMGGTIPLDGQALPGTPPDVMFGCEVDATGDCREREDGPGDKQLRLAIGRPSGDWVAALGERLDAANAGTALLVTLEIGQYWVHQRNFAGSKEVRLGRDHVVDVPWLTSLDAPVHVVQLTGALLDRNGRALRIGAEGLYVRRTNLLASGFGLQSLVSEEDIARIRQARRDDLPGRPLVWEAALESLVRDLLRP